MNKGDLKSASTLAQQFGVKILCYGQPGSGKTPIAATLPNPVMCVTEPGMLSMRGIGIPAFEAYTADKASEFFDWLFKSKEAASFDTVIIDSVSQLAELILTQELERNKDGRAAYGMLSRRMMAHLNGLYFLEGKHVYLTAKESKDDVNGVVTRKPYFPGQDLNVKVPHLFDEIFYLGEARVPTMPKPVTALRTQSTFGILARDRSGRLNELEPPDLGAVIIKCLS